MATESNCQNNITKMRVLLTFMTSIVELARVKGAVGRATPSRTGAISESAVSHNSSTASLISAWKTLLHFING